MPAPALSAFVASPASTQNPQATDTVNATDIKAQPTAKEVLSICEAVFQRGENKTLRFPCFPEFTVDIYDKIWRSWDDANASLSDCSLRMTSTANFPVIIELLPSRSHQTTVAGIAHLITETFGAVTRTQSWRHFAPLGADSLRLNSPYDRVKQADASFAPAAHAMEPSVIIEVGRSETITELRGDVSHWFSLDSIKLVILFEIGKPPSATPNTPTLSVEIWLRITDSSRRLTRTSIQDWTQGIPGAFSIPIWTLLGLQGPEDAPADLPEQLELPKYGLEALRTRIIHKWIREEDQEEHEE